MFLEFSRKKLLEQYWPRLRACIESLSDEEVWWRPNGGSAALVVIGVALIALAPAIKTLGQTSVAV